MRRLLCPAVFFFVCLILIGPIVAIISSPSAWYACAVTRIIDGDTIQVKLGKRLEKVRLIGVNTPETVHPNKDVELYGRQASRYTKQQLSKKKVYLEMDVQHRDRYSRLLAYVWTAKPTRTPPSKADMRSRLFNAILLLNGYAQVMTVPPNVKYTDRFIRFQLEAMKQEKGLWGIIPGKQSVRNLSTSAKASDLIVYITYTGEKYHRSGCKCLIKSKIPIRLSEAKMMGYTPCKICKPVR